MEAMVTTGCAMKETVIITFEKLFYSDNRINISILKSMLKETICILCDLTKKLYQGEMP